MALTLLLATRNRHKARELRRMFSKTGMRLIGLDRFPGIPSAREDGATFRANAVKKALAVSRRSPLPVLAEDSGLEVFALRGEPGVRSARYALRQAQGERTQSQMDQANNRKLLRLLKRVPPARRKGRFVCVMALAIGGKLIRTFSGACAGSIALEPAGRGGFGYDPVFIPRGRRRTMAQLAPKAKDALSHRGAAAGRLRRWLFSQRLE